MMLVAFHSDLMEESAENIYAKHRGLIKALISSIVINNPAVVSTDDLQQTGALALMMALKSYDPSIGSFQTYIRRCIRNALLEQANTFNGVFTVDEKIRRQANKVIKLREQGLEDSEIMRRLGIRNKDTMLSLIELTHSTVDVKNLDTVEEENISENDIMRMLGEIGLDEIEQRFVALVIDNKSMDELEKEMGTSRANLYSIKRSIKDKILAWGEK